MSGESSEVNPTQCFDSLQVGDEEEAEFPEGVWGKLLSLNPDYPDVLLSSAQLTIGRSEKCNVPFKLNVHLSGTHCTVLRDATVGMTFIHDHSSNGTFLNGNMLGKNNKSVLKAMDEVALLPTKQIRYIYKERCMLDTEDVEGPGKYYYIRHTLGTGNFASVKLGVHKETNAQVAIKCIDKKKMVGGSSRTEAIRDEINILESVSHPHIIRIFEHYENDSTIWLVLELVEGGELFDFLVKYGIGGLPETSAREIFRQICEAVTYLHGLGISHRDLKPENILLGSRPDSEDGPFLVKLSDFGLSRLVGEGSFMKTMCGTPSYLAPEVLGKGAKLGYDHKVDIWSMGVILYILLSGTHPFDEASSGVLDRITRAEFSFNDKVWQTVSAEAIHCVQHCLVTNVQKRYSAKQCLEHPFVTGKTLPSVEFAAPSAKAASEVSSVAAVAAVGAESPGKKHKPLSEGDDLREICKYGKSCYRKNQDHFEKFAHPWLGK